MPHDPSTCPRCCWLAEREGYEYKEDGWLPQKSSPQWRRRYHPFEENAYGYHRHLPPFCTSLDAVAGILKELFRRGWAFEWSEFNQEWVCYFRRGEKYFSKDYSCIIDAAMATLGKENDDISHND